MTQAAQLVLGFLYSTQSTRSAFDFARLFLACLLTMTASSGLAQQTTRNIPTWSVESLPPSTLLWKARIGRDAGTPVVYRNLVLIGTNNDAQWDPNVVGDHAALMCFALDNGTFVWQMTHARLDHRAHDLPGIGLICRPCIDDNRCYYQNNRGEVTCIDLQTRRNATPSVAWKLDLVGKLGIFKRDACDIGNPQPSPVIDGDTVYCVSGNGSTFGYPFDFGHLPFVPRPSAPSFLAIDKKDGHVRWSSNAPGADIQYGQWGSPTIAIVDGTPIVLFPGGDGCLYAFKQVDGTLVGKINCNGSRAKRWEVDRRGERVYCLSRPTIFGNMAYFGLNQDLEKRGDVSCPVMAIDLRRMREGDPVAIRWKFTDKSFDGTVGPVAADEKCIYAMSGNGLLVALDRATGQVKFRCELSGASRFGGPVINRGRLFVASEEDLWVFSIGEEIKCRVRIQFNEQLMGDPTPNGEKIIIASGGHLWCIRLPE